MRTFYLLYTCSTASRAGGGDADGHRGGRRAYIEGVRVHVVGGTYILNLILILSCMVILGPSVLCIIRILIIFIYIAYYVLSYPDVYIATGSPPDHADSGHALASSKSWRRTPSCSTPQPRPREIDRKCHASRTEVASPDGHVPTVGGITTKV